MPIKLEENLHHLTDLMTSLCRNIENYKDQENKKERMKNVKRGKCKTF